ncbi:ATPase, P-type (transporting), HAD superfamily, protein (macronuclear) [Tetrahymena thermophila SB210]|uniref:ATPase, P-type (Transporting), HAD superfamily, protein n=1 Tax=Tetrahymena thermophila (strain SB210) TaxID=312017 RepID=Q23WM9_TETTS|nr:ATPase, P-type (transporting), HAD superfamily, protein [Tetrahymena thermophila SB210]EAS00951.3 ATPase, P-type (transporting), HAD superfamily, protein [Tetrahymena thermophila SB210]|eukprot:XP_001021196.3 ATPase, P-type (transporting), HAD superfamily, protein [Tetrahymena thermophila SB210]
MTNLLIEGTTIVKLEDQETKVLVVRTGFYSFKGQLIRSILFPSSQNFQFFVDGYKLSLFVALVSLIAYLSTVPAFIFTSLPEKIIIFRFFEIIVNSFPPGIPLLILQSIFFSFAKLKKKQILGSDISQAIQAGRVTTICFDKTGTLTENEVDFIGFQQPYSQHVDNENYNRELSCILFKLLSICHQAYEINGTFIGDPIDVKILQFSGWKVQYDVIRNQRFSQYKNERVYCLQVNEFHSECQSMSVIVEDLADQNSKYVFVKGSPESILQKLDHQTDKQQIEYQLNILISQGFRVLAAGYKKVPNREFQNILSLNRSEQEQGISFLCFLIFKNRLKKKTQEITNELNNADYNLKVVSGDNPFTIYNVARDCKLLKSPDKNLLIIDKCNKTKDYFTITEVQKEGLQNVKIFKAENSYEILIQQIKYCTEVYSKGINLCLTGTAQHFLENYKSQSMYSQKTTISFKHIGSLQNNTFDQRLDLFYNFLIRYCQIFARTSPIQKANIIKQLKLNGEIVCMVGDGANDCQAIKEADLGISFTNSDGQFSALFISKNKEIDCVKEILLEGRITLSVASESIKGYIQILALRYFYYCYNILSNDIINL